MGRKKWRDVLFVLHRYIGLVVGIVLAIVGLTGSMLVFFPEIEDFALHQQIGPLVAPQGEVKSLDAILKDVKATYANRPNVKIHGISPSGYHSLYQGSVTPVAVSLEEKIEGKEEAEWSETFFNPHTGAMLTKREWEGSLSEKVFELHYQLLAGEKGMYFVGVVGLLSTILSVTGILLWPGWRNLFSGFKIKWDGHIKRLNFDLHKVSGIIVAVFLTMVTFTGFCWNFWTWSEPAIYAVTLSPKPEPPVSKPLPGKSPLSLAEVSQKANEALPEGKIIYITLPEDDKGAFEVRKKLLKDSNYWGEHTIQIDQYSGDIIAVNTTSTNSLGTKIVNSFSTMHYGTFGGLWTRILYIFVGLSPTFLMVTGFIMWYYRKRYRRPKDYQKSKPLVPNLR